MKTLFYFEKSVKYIDRLTDVIFNDAHLCYCGNEPSVFYSPKTGFSVYCPKCKNEVVKSDSGEYIVYQDDSTAFELWNEFRNKQILALNKII